MYIGLLLISLRWVKVGKGGFKPWYAQTSPVFRCLGVKMALSHYAPRRPWLLGNLLNGILVYWVCKGICIGLVPCFCLYSALHRQVIAAVFCSVSCFLEPARSFCFACEEAPLLHAGLLLGAMVTLLVGLLVCSVLPVCCRLDSSKETGSAAV